MSCVVQVKKKKILIIIILKLITININYINMELYPCRIHINKLWFL